MIIKNVIKQFESLALKPYICPAGKLTVGYGHVITKDSKYNRKITLEEAESLLDYDIELTRIYISRHVKVSLKKYQLDALISFVFNVGPNAFFKSTLLRKINSGLFNDASKEFGKWVYAKAVKLPGLVKRRKLEKEIFEGQYA